MRLFDVKLRVVSPEGCQQYCQRHQNREDKDHFIAAAKHSKGTKEDRPHWYRYRTAFVAGLFLATPHHQGCGHSDGVDHFDHHCYSQRGPHHRIFKITPHHDRSHPGTNWEFWKPTKWDIWGFVLSWVMVAVIIFLYIFVMNIGACPPVYTCRSRPSTDRLQRAGSMFFPPLCCTIRFIFSFYCNLSTVQGVM